MALPYPPAHPALHAVRTGRAADGAYRTVCTPHVTRCSPCCRPFMKHSGLRHATVRGVQGWINNWESPHTAGSRLAAGWQGQGASGKADWAHFSHRGAPLPSPVQLAQRSRPTLRGNVHVSFGYYYVEVCRWCTAARKWAHRNHPSPSDFSVPSAAQKCATETATIHAFDLTGFGLARSCHRKRRSHQEPRLRSTVGAT